MLSNISVSCIGDLCATDSTSPYIRGAGWVRCQNIDVRVTKNEASHVSTNEK